MADDDPLQQAGPLLARALAASGFRTDLGCARRLGTGDAWLLGRDGDGVASGDLLILKRGRPEQDAADVTWEHAFVERLGQTGFPAQMPVSALDGQSWVCLDGRAWATLRYLTGRSLLWSPEPGLDAAGALLAAYHQAARGVQMDAERPSAVALGQVRELTRWDRLDEALADDEGAERFGILLDEIEAELDGLGYRELERLVIHGDATVDNLIVDGQPPRLVGLIDFGAAHRDAWLADLGAALWRSGRPDPASIGYDLGRVARFVAGYHASAPLQQEHARAIPIFTKARGLQLIARQTRRIVPRRAVAAAGYARTSLERAEWVRAHQDLLADALVDALAAPLA